MHISQTKNSPQDYTLYLVLFLFALAFRIVFLIWIDEPILFSKYTYFAQKLAQGEDIGDRIVDLSPFYLYFSTASQIVFGDNGALIKWIQSFVGALACLILFGIGSRLFNRETGFIGTLIYAAYGNLIVLESTLEPTVFVILFNMLVIHFMFKATDGPETDAKNPPYSLPAGLFTGLSIITKPSFLLFLPIGFTFFFIHTPGERWRKWRRSIGYLAVALMVVMPVTVRNWIHVDDVILVTADAGKVFFHGNARSATALEWTGLPNKGFSEEEGNEPDYAHVLFRKTASRLSGKPLSPSEASSFWFQTTLDHIKMDLRRYAIREFKKALFFFTDYEMHYIASAYKEYKETLNYPFIRYGVIAALGLTGMCLAASRFRKLYPLYGVISVYLISGLIFIVQSRYRTPAVPYLCLFAGYSLYRIKKTMLWRKTGRAALIILLTGLLFFVSRFSFRSEILKSDRWQEATRIHYQMGAMPLFVKGHYKQAVKKLDACLLLAPGFSPAYNLRGKSLAVLGQESAALADFKKVIALNPDAAQGYRNAGFIYLLQGQKDHAGTFLKKALVLAPADTKVREAIDKLR